LAKTLISINSNCFAGIHKKDKLPETNLMKKRFFHLGTSENDRFVKVIRILFGITCIVVAAFWLIYNINSLKTEVTIWITIIFLSGFGFFQIGSGLGYTTRFIEIGTVNIRLKKNAILPPFEMLSDDIEKIELLPLNIIFFLKTQKHKRILLRFGTTYHETNDQIIDEIIDFANANQIPFEIIEEEL